MLGVLVEVAPWSARVAGGRGGRFALGSVASSLVLEDRFFFFSQRVLRGGGVILLFV